MSEQKEIITQPNTDITIDYPITGEYSPTD